MSTVDVIRDRWLKSTRYDTGNIIKEIFESKWYEPMLKQITDETTNEILINNRTKIEDLTGHTVKIDENYALKRAGQWLSSL